MVSGVMTIRAITKVSPSASPPSAEELLGSLAKESIRPLVQECPLVVQRDRCDLGKALEWIAVDVEHLNTVAGQPIVASLAQTALEPEHELLAVGLDYHLIAAHGRVDDDIGDACLQT